MKHGSPETDPNIQKFREITNQLGGGALLALFSSEGDTASAVFPSEDEQLGIAVSGNKVRFANTTTGVSGSVDIDVARYIAEEAFAAEERARQARASS